MRTFHPHKPTLNFTFLQQEKTTKDFIQTRCHPFKMLCQNHWNQNQKSRLRFQSHAQPCEDPMAVEPDYECALDRLGQLDKQHKDKNFGFYGKYFRQTHGRNLNFYKYRKSNPVGHPHARFEFDEGKFIDSYVHL